MTGGSWTSTLHFGQSFFGGGTRGATGASPRTVPQRAQAGTSRALRSAQRGQVQSIVSGFYPKGYNPAMSTPPGKRRPYKPPAVKTEKLFERKSLACGKGPRGRPRGGCARNQRNS